eukprot:TRINITY_DN3266_c0_g2_i2.p1 TRINITY_DN3266_c0_g2~~TRINITY_DN3266_c0_g2_i2.p1  ORF type:complete len:806 (+),score=128.74 TRINITY_DN3266_c0_g2_i2:285-2702(+)
MATSRTLSPESTPPTELKLNSISRPQSPVPRIAASSMTPPTSPTSDLRTPPATFFTDDILPTAVVMDDSDTLSKPGFESLRKVSFRQRALSLVVEFEHLEALYLSKKKSHEVDPRDCTSSGTEVSELPANAPRADFIPSLDFLEHDGFYQKSDGAVAGTSSTDRRARIISNGMARDQEDDTIKGLRSSLLASQLATANDLEAHQKCGVALFFGRIKKATDEFITAEELLALLRLKFYTTISVDALNGLFDELRTCECERNSESLHFSDFYRLVTSSTIAFSVNPSMLEVASTVQTMLADLCQDDAIARFMRVSLSDLVSISGQSFMSKAADVTICTVIFANGIVVGLSSDVDWDGFQIVEWLFLGVFALELLLKLGFTGLKSHFCGPGSVWNIFDLFVLLFGGLDAAFSTIVPEKSSNINGASIVRLVRLARLSRLVRLLRLRVFKELLLMIKGIIAGLRTLFWAMVLLFMGLFVIGVFLRQTVGTLSATTTTAGDSCRETGSCSEKDISFEHVRHHNGSLFATVPWAMFTVFRCLTDGCSSADGTPLNIHLHRMYGAGFLLPYWFTFIFFTWGLFNLVMAIFVENVMEAARQKRELVQRDQCIHVARILRKFVYKFSEAESIEQEHESDGVLVRIGQFFGLRKPQQAKCSLRKNVKITRKQFEYVITQPEVAALLDELEVTVFDRLELFDVLDADDSGELDVGEMLGGMMKLRGGADKSDIVALLLRVRSLQKFVIDFQEKLVRRQERMMAKVTDLGQWIVYAGASLSGDEFPPQDSNAGSGKKEKKEEEAVQSEVGSVSINLA